MSRGEKCCVPLWLLPSLWGVDVPATAFFWGVAIARLLGVPLMTPAPMVLMVAAVWVAVLSHRLFVAFKGEGGWQESFYERYSALLLAFLLGGTLALLWMAFFFVERYFLSFTVFPVVLLLLGCMPLPGRFRTWRGLFLSLSFAFSCAVPASFYCFTMLPLEMAFVSPMWYMGFLFFLFYLSRREWRSKEKENSFVITVGLCALLTLCLLSARTESLFEANLCYMVATGAACLQLLRHAVPRLGGDAVLAISWLVLALPAVLGKLVYISFVQVPLFFLEP